MMMNEETTSRSGGTALWASAFVIAALVFVTAGRHSQNAHAQSASTASGFTLLTTPDGRGSDFLYLIDDETSMLMVYSVRNPQLNTVLELSAAWYLPAMFSKALN
jgi:hypothetical protein